MTMFGNIHEREECLKVADLHQTLRNAVQVTRWLGIGYLWIDAICILQDITEDWETESAKMMSMCGRFLVSLVSQNWIPLHFEF